MLSDFESDLTSLSSDEEDYVPVPQKRKVQVKAKNDYRIQNHLKPPRTTTYTVKSLYDQIIDNTIQLDPEYQRDVVWPESKQVGLIDSILRNYYIPPVIFAVTTQDDGSESRVCIDGKQRLTSIQLFIDGLICHKDSCTNKKFWYKDGSGAKRTLLPKQYMHAFAHKQIVCVEYDGLNGDQEREIFQRVQLGVALTPAERMQAITGPWPTLIREIQSKVLGEEGFGDDLDWGHARGRDFQCLASIVYLIDGHPDVKFPGAAQLDKWLQLRCSVQANFRTEVLDTFKTFVMLVKDKRYNAAFQKPTRVSPVEFTMIGVLIHLYRTKLSLMQLSTAIWNMRADVRTKHADVRSNTKVTKTMFDFISKKVKIKDLQNVGTDDSPAPATTKSTRAKASEPKKPAKKRRRIGSSSEDDDDDENNGGHEAAERPRKRPAPKPTTTRAAAAKTAATITRQTAPKKPAAKATSSSKITTAKAASSNKTPVKPIASSPATKPSKLACSTTSRTSTTAAQCQVQPQAQPAASVPSSATSQSCERAAASPLERQGTAIFLQRQSPASGSASSSRALPRKSPSSAPSLPRSVLHTPIEASSPQVQVKREPDSDVGLTKASSVDRLAPLRAAKANLGSLATPLKPPVCANGLHPTSGLGQSINDYVLDGMAPIKSERPRLPLPSLDTGLSGLQQAHRAPSEQSPAMIPTIPAGQIIDQASVDDLLARRYKGQTLCSRLPQLELAGPNEPVKQVASSQSPQLPPSPFAAMMSGIIQQQQQPITVFGQSAQASMPPPPPAEKGVLGAKPLRSPPAVPSFPPTQAPAPPPASAPSPVQATPPPSSASPPSNPAPSFIPAGSFANGADPVQVPATSHENPGMATTSTIPTKRSYPSEPSTSASTALASSLSPAGAFDSSSQASGHYPPTGPSVQSNSASSIPSTNGLHGAEPPPSLPSGPANPLGPRASLDSQRKLLITPVERTRDPRRSSYTYGDADSDRDRDRDRGKPWEKDWGRRGYRDDRDWTRDPRRRREFNGDEDRDRVRTAQYQY